MDRKKFNFIFIFLSILFVTNILIFVMNFNNQNISDNIEDWANFSTYLSGISNIIISIMTLIVTIYIAFTLNKIEENRNKENKEYDKNKFMRELREKEYSEISTNLNNVWENITLSNRSRARDQLYIINMRFNNFIKYKKYLFQDLDTEKFQKLNSTLASLHTLASTNLETDNPKSTEILERFNQESEFFHKEIQNYIISN